ncbi:MAG: serine/threonine-protein phosphatase [Planctomycetota bacterium]|nr:serine/threonine-protein phosphatase [Planctomycetota bacterium]
MKVYYEWAAKQIVKRGEELCGDSIAVSRRPDGIVAVLSDGLGSGVKANILATLTTRIASHLLENDIPLDEVVQTISETLPVCRVRRIAYSTFLIARMGTDGSLRLVEFDTPPAFFLRDGRIVPLDYGKREADGKTLREAAANVRPGDWLVLVSDGVVNAGIGGAHPLGWGWDQIAAFIERCAARDISADEMVGRLADAAGELYAGPPGDDVTIAAVKARRVRFATVMAGPPKDRTRDGEVVEALISSPGRRIVCGGTTARIVAARTGRGLEVDLDTMTPDVPPMGSIAGVDLVTEGVLTLTKTLELVRSGVSPGRLAFGKDGASRLAGMLLSADVIRLLVGQAINPAHQNPDLPSNLGIRSRIILELAEELRKLGKQVSVEMY